MESWVSFDPSGRGVSGTVLDARRLTAARSREAAKRDGMFLFFALRLPGFSVILGTSGEKTEVFEMRWKIIRAGRAILFSLLACVIFGGLSLLFQPEWLEWNNYDTIHGFYEQPENTVETVILGASVAVQWVYAYGAL